MLSKRLGLCLALALSGFSATAAAQSVSGHGRGRQDLPFVGGGSDAALMSSFYFNFTNDDHHIEEIEFAAHNPHYGRASVNFQDKDANDTYFYNLSSHPYFGSIDRPNGKIWEVCRNRCTVPLDAPPDAHNWVFVLRGFRFFYNSSDHHIQEIRVMENGTGGLDLAFNDDDNNDVFTAEIDYLWIPRSRFSAVSEASGAARGAAALSVPAGQKVVRGFKYVFRNNDHHIKEFGAWLPNNGTGSAVYFADHNRDDTFDYIIRYGVLAN